MATLKEQFELDSIVTPYTEQMVVIADKYAIEFGNWIGDYFIALHQGKSKTYFSTAEEALEQFKKDRGY